MDFIPLSLLEWGVFDSRVKFPRATKTQPRPLQHYELELYIQDQPGTAFLQNVAIPMRRGTLICAKPGQIRFSKLHYKCLYIHLACHDKTLIQLLNRLPDSCILPDPDSIEALWNKLLKLDVEQFPQEQLMLQSYTLALLYDLLRDTGACSPGHSSISLPHLSAMRRTERYIRSNLTEDLSLNALAHQANLSPSYFHKLFCLHFAMTPSQFVQSCRISAAKNLLITGEMSVGQIAESCGFGSQTYFNSRFREAVGVTPSQYRRDQLSRMGDVL